MHHLHKVYLLAAVAILLISCGKFLEVNPDNRTDLDSPDKIKSLVATAYNRSSSIIFAECASDNAEDKGPSSLGSATLTLPPYTWSDNLSVSTSTPISFWYGCYNAIKVANEALDAIEKKNFGDAALPYKGEALIARAYAAHMLAIFFATPYEPGGSNSGMGIPYPLKPGRDVFTQYSRATVKDTYAQILKDIEEGLPLLRNSAYEQPKNHFSPPAAHAFASRVYLFLGEWRKAVTEATLAAPGGNFAGKLRPVNTTFKAWTETQHRDNFASTDLACNLLVIPSDFVLSVVRYGLGIKVDSMFINPTVTGGKLANKIRNTSSVSPNFNTFKFNNYSFNNGQSDQANYSNIPIFTTDEALLNRAEAYAELNLFDSSLNDLNLFYSTKIDGYNTAANNLTLERVQNYFGISDPKLALVEAVLAAKKAEFVQEGMRWLDVTRRKITVVHNFWDPKGLTQTYDSLAHGDLRRVFQLPNESGLSGVPLNPR